MVVAVQYRRLPLKLNVMEQMYGIDLGLSSFEVSFFDVQGKLHQLKQVRNTVEGIGHFLSLLPPDACLCAEYTGLYGDLLLHLCNYAGVRICFVPGYEIKHSLGLQRGKSDEVDACRIREYAERFSDRLQTCFAPTEELEELQELYRTRGQLVESRKRLSTLNKGDNCKVMVSLVAARARQHLLDELDEQIRGLDAEIERLIKSNSEQEKSYRILTSIPGVGPITACELIIKTENFQKLDTAKRCAAYAGIAPYPKESGKMKCNNHSSPLGDKHLKSLLFLCARSAKDHNKEILLYFIQKYQIEKKPYYLVMNNVANKLLRILYSLIHKGELYDRDYIQIDPRNNQEIRKEEKAKWAS